MTMGDRESEAQGEEGQGWKPDRASDYDYCMVFAVDKQTNGLPKVGNNFCNKMVKAGLDLYLFYSIRKTHIFVLIRASVENLRIFADGIEFPMLLDAEKLKEAAERGDAEAGIAPIDITHDPEVTPLLPHEHIYAKYRTEIPEELYWRPEGMSHPFRESVRLKLIQSMIEAKPKDGSHNIKIRSVIRSHCIHNNSVQISHPEEENCGFLSTAQSPRTGRAEEQVANPPYAALATTHLRYQGITNAFHIK